MTRRQLTDDQIAAGLRAHLPVGYPGLHQRILDEIATSPQERRLPSILGRLTDADPMGRRRTMLLLALVALALSLSVTAIAGALLRQQRAPELSLDPPTDVDAFVLGAYAKLAELPAFTFIETAADGPRTTYHYDGEGALREEADGQVTIFTSDVIAHARDLGGQPTWVISQGAWGDALSRLTESGPPTCPGGWEYVELAYVIERPTHHVRCVSVDEGMGAIEGHHWVDIDSGLVLRSRESASQPTGSGSFEPMGMTFSEIVALEFAPQPAELFLMDGATMSADRWACEVEGECPSQGPASPEPDPSTTPVITPPPVQTKATIPIDLDAFVASVHAAYAEAEPVDIRIDATQHPNIRRGRETRWQRDGVGGYRSEIDLSPGDGLPGVVFLITAGRVYETDPRPDGRTWRDWGVAEGPSHLPTMGLPEICGAGWRHLGFDRVLDRPAHHLECAFQEFWVDVDWLFVTRAHDHDPMLGDDPGAGLSEATAITFGPQPQELFEAPAPDDVWSY